jgi:hypothetical protein
MVNCFYVYPTVSTETTTNANLAVQPAEVSAAVAQAAQFSQACAVWAPVYRQVTVSGLAKEGLTDNRFEEIAYASVLSAWKDFLAHDDGGRHFVLIGHSQGAAMLIDLVRQQIDPNPAERDLLVSAILLGGNVQVPDGKLVGGSFKNVPACSSGAQTRCVIAYSSFSTTPPPNSFFGRPGEGVSLQSGQSRRSGEQVLCVNPAQLSGTGDSLVPIFPRPGRVLSPWVEFPGLYTASCKSEHGATWLAVTAHPGASDSRPIVEPTLGPRWGLHLYDVSLALGNLVTIVEKEISSLDS